MGGQGIAKARDPSAVLHHSDSAYSKTVAVYCDFVFCAGSPGLDQVTILRCTKHRRKPEMRPLPIKIDGAVQMVTDASATHPINRISGQLPAQKGEEEKAQVSSLPAQAQPAPAQVQARAKSPHVQAQPSPPKILPLWEAIGGLRLKTPFTALPRVFFRIMTVDEALVMSHLLCLCRKEIDRRARKEPAGKVLNPIRPSCTDSQMEEATGLSAQTVKRRVRPRLVERGFIKVTKKRPTTGGGYAITVYSVCFEVLNKALREAGVTAKELIPGQG